MTKYTIESAFSQAVKAHRAGDFKTADRYYTAILQKQPEHADANHNLGLIASHLGKDLAAIPLFEKAIISNPNVEQFHFSLVQSLIRVGKYHRAKELLGEASKNGFNPHKCAIGFNNLGNSYKHKENLQLAAHCYEQAIKLKPDLEISEYLLHTTKGTTPKTAPNSYIEALFDQYASKFEQTLLGKLEYSGPMILSKLVRQCADSKKFANVLDLGCGTGLMGDALDGYAARLTGVDISSQMLSIAEKKGTYANLRKSEISAFLASHELNFDLIVSADVFIYVGDLEQIFTNIKKRSVVSGVFAFCTEHSHEKDFVLGTNGRFSHSTEYIERLCKDHSFDLKKTEIHDFRKDNGNWQSGGFYVTTF